ncbi:anti-CBASS protein Acb1 family protein [Sphingomonas baiyangensis]|uniref:anti-CBASS protein Acb1 family protein n=1 Tax=Sphingomonas baiyangensis TaxID=2572576 RepID=UPI00146C45B5|nr:anti-CBASS Acb1 family protein [Sphingomonas baiyangensis]
MLRNITDSLTNALTGLGTRSDARTARVYRALQLSGRHIEEAFEGSAMLRKAITIPATDRVRAWRDWQADGDQIEALEAEEQRHQIKAKVRQAEVLRGLGGGALILITAGDPMLPVNERTISKGALQALNVVSRWHLSAHDWIDDLASPDYGKPRYWEINTTGRRTRLHPSRVVCFTAEPLPSIYRASYEDRFWGRGRVPSLLEPAQNLDEALATFGSLIKDALNVDLGVSGLLNQIATEEGEALLMRRFAAMRAGMGALNAVVYDKGDAEGKGGESIDRHQVTWAGIPDIIRVYAEALSAASDIPVTRLWGTSPKGLNATGEHDDGNWNKMVETGQELELRPCLDQLDAVLIPSALGSRPAEIWWKFAPLDVPSEKAETDRFKVWVDSAEKVQLSGAIPDRAFAKAYQNGLTENGWMPGLEGALAEEPKETRFGGMPEDDGTDPSEIVAGQGREVIGDLPGGGEPDGSDVPARRAANDSKGGGRQAEPPFLHDYNSRQPRDRNGRWITGGARGYVAAAASNRAVKQTEIGDVSASTAVLIGRLGHSAGGKAVALDPGFTRHILKTHGGASERKRGQVPVTQRDIATVTSKLNRATNFRRGEPPTGRQGNPRIEAISRTSRIDTHMVFEVRKKRLVLVTMYKKSRG